MTQAPAVTVPSPTGLGTPVLPPGARLIPLFPEPCRKAIGSPLSTGYVARWYRGKMRRAHRLRWIEEHGEIPDDLDVLHHCDVRWCDEITHLYLGTDLDNARDREQRHRRKNNPARGVHHGKAKLDPDKVRAIRAARGTVSQRELARRYGVSKEAIRDVQSHKNWRDVI